MVGVGGADCVGGGVGVGALVGGGVEEVVGEDKGEAKIFSLSLLDKSLSIFGWFGCVGLFGVSGYQLW